jgi:release factor glutamine methyltransferase
MPVASARDPGALVGARPTVRAALDLAAAALAAAGVDTARADAEWLLADVLGVTRTALGLRAGSTLEPPADARYAAALRRRLAREPLQHIVGTQAFRQVTVRVTGDALVPRPETEVLAGWALELLPAPPRRPVVIDLGTGGGCIACALATERPDAEVIALDVSPAAVELARDNVVTLGLATRVHTGVSDMFAALGAIEVDLIVSNPPYLPTGLLPTLPPEVSRWDPRLALDGGPDGLDVIRRVVREAPARLAAGGALVLETGGGGQVEAVVALLQASGFDAVQTRADLAGIERFVAGRRAGRTA